MRYPDVIQPGDGIGFPAPSFGCAIQPYHDAFINAMKKLKELGYETVPGPNAFAGDGIGISSTPENCGKELTQMYLDQGTKALISCGGGELMCETLDHVDFEAIRQGAPKWYMGYSDNTNMTFLLATLCDTASLYGPCAPAFGMEPWHDSLKDAFGLLTGEVDTVAGYPLYEVESLKDEEHPLEPYHVTKKRRIIAYNAKGTRSKRPSVRMKGRLLGGCMDCLVNLTGTRYDRTAEFAEHYAEDGIIWFLEACDLNVFGIRRAIWNMKRAGWFEHTKGFLIGRPLCHGQEMMGLDQYSAVAEPLKELGVPILFDLDIGHIPPMMPIMCGAMAEVQVTGQQLKLTYLKR